MCITALKLWLGNLFLLKLTHSGDKLSVKTKMEVIILLYLIYATTIYKSIAILVEQLSIEVS